MLYSRRLLLLMTMIMMMMMMIIILNRTVKYIIIWYGRPCGGDVLRVSQLGYSIFSVVAV